MFEQRIILRDHPDHTGLRGHQIHAVPGDFNTAAIRRLQSGQNSQELSFAHAARPEQATHLATHCSVLDDVFDFKIDAVENMIFAQGQMDPLCAEQCRFFGELIHARSGLFLRQHVRRNDMLQPA